MSSSRLKKVSHLKLPNDYRFPNKKPKFLPIAKSKLFKVPPTPQISPEERAKLQFFTNVYNTEMKSIRSFLVQDFKAYESKDQEYIKKEKEEELEKDILKMNEFWNREIAQIRAQRLEKEAKKRKESILNKLMEKEKMEKEELEKIEQIIKEEKIKSATYISKENIDLKIEEALANPVDNSYAIDLKGNIIKGFGDKMKIIENKQENTS